MLAPSIESDSHVGKLFIDFLHGNLYTRLKALDDLYERIIDADNEIKPGPCKRLLRLIMYSLISLQFTEKAWKSCLTAYVLKLSSVPNLPFTFRETFFETLIELSSTLKFGCSRVASLELSVLLVKSFIDELASDSSAVSNTSCLPTLISWQGVQIEAIGSANETRYLERSIHKVLAWLQPTRHNDLLTTYISIWGDTVKGSTFGICAILTFLQKSLATLSNELLTICRIRVNELFSKRVLNAKALPNNGVIEAYRPYLSSLTLEEWHGIEAVLVRTIKKAPESASGLVAALVVVVPMDMLVLVRDALSQSAVKMLKSAEEAVRENGVMVVTSVAGHCPDAPLLSALLHGLRDAILGKGGIIPQPTQRQAVISALGGSASGTLRSLGAEASSVISGQLLCSLLPTLEKEGDENVRILGFQAMSKWAAMPQALTTDAMEVIKAGISKTKNISALYLMLLAQVLDESPSSVDSALSAFLSLLPVLTGVIKEAMKKPTLVHLDAAFALRVTLEVATISLAAVEVLSSGKLWSTVSSSSSFLFCSALQQQLWTSSDASGYRVLYQTATVSVARSIALTSVNHSTSVDLFPSDCKLSILDGIKSEVDSSRAVTSTVDKLNPGPVAALVFGSLSRELSVRRTVCKCLQSVASSPFPWSVSQLLHSLLMLLSRLGEERERALKDAMLDLKAMSIAEDAAEVQGQGQVSAASMVDTIPPSYFADALLGCIHQDSVSSALDSGASAHLASAFSLALLVSAHPLVSPSTNRAVQVLRSVVRAFGGTDVVEDLVGRHDVASEVSIRIEHAVSYPSSEAMRIAGQRASYLLCVVLGTPGVTIVQTSIMSSYLAKLSLPEVFELSEADVSTYLDPAAAMAVVTESASTEEIKITNADRRKTGGRSSRKGTFGTDLAEDADWAEQVKREKAKKLGLNQASGMTEAQERRSKEVEEIVARVTAVVAPYKHTLEALRFLVEGLPDIVLCGPVPVVPAVMRLLESKLLNTDVMNCVVAMCRSLEKELRPIASDLANSVRLVVQVLERPLGKKETWPQRMKSVQSVSGPLCRCVTSLQGVMSRGVRLRPSTVQLVFPVLRGALSLPTLLPGCEAAFMVLDACWPNLEAAEARGKDSEISATKSALESLTPLRKAVLELCLRVMAKFRCDPPPDKLLMRASVQQELNPGDWTPLLSSYGILSEEAHIRSACLRTVMVMALRGVPLRTNPLLESRLWLLRHDEDNELSQLATSVWTERDVPLSTSFAAGLLPLLSHEHSHVRISAGKAIAAGCLEHPSLVASVLERLEQCLLNALPLDAMPISSSKFGKEEGSVHTITMRAVEEEDTTGPTRSAIAVAFAAFGSMRAVSAELAPTAIPSLVNFLLTHGVVDSLPEVQEAMVAAGRALLDGYGPELSSDILMILEAVLARQPDKTEAIARFDLRREAAVVLLGAVGKHLDKGSENIVTITRTLVKALSTPSESVQKSVADCLTPLIQSLKTNDSIKDMFESLMANVVGSETYGERRGAAYGISAFVKGLGIPCLKQYDVVTRLKDACTSGSVNNRQGALFAFECLSDRLGLLFEPYIITILPILLKSFSHASDHVREAAQMAAKVIMGRLSAHGVKQVLQPILTSLTEEQAWKSRQEAIRLLGTMAHCAPKQLASCLPQIVPRLVEAGSDPHPKVKESARSAMTDISSVIRNPEIKRLGPVLLAALADPAGKTKEALESLLECEFMHSIDAPSLAILVPILGRALRDRSADLKRRSSAITGHICSMITDPKVLVPYLHQVLPGLKEVLVDPIPDVRASSAKALGSLISGVGEAELPDLLPWLMETLTSEASPVERSGAAQGLAEVCLSLGKDRMGSILTEALSLRSHAKDAAREGMQWLLSFLPASLGDGFASYIQSCLPVVLLGLSDANEGVREVALRGGQVIVSVCGRNHTTKLLPSLREGMFDDDWRIRQSSVSLLGELLYQVGDARAVGVADGDEDDDDDDARQGGGSRVTLAIRAHIGDKMADEVFASLYIVRADSSITVRQIALQVWKSVISNTPRTLREIMPCLVSQIIEMLSSESSDLRQVTGKALGEVVKKLGNVVLPEIVPQLQDGLTSDDESVRGGVCLGLSEILNASTRTQVEDYIDVLVPALQQALCDSSDDVRAQAAQAFHTLFKNLGAQAIAEVVPSLLARLDDEDGSGLLGLRVVVQVRPRDLLEYLLPKLLVSPISISSANALGAVAIVASNQLAYHCQIISSGFIAELIAVSAESESSGDTSRLDAVKACAANMLGAIATNGVNSIVSELGKEAEHDFNLDRRRWGCWLLGQFCSNTKSDYDDYIPVILKHLLCRVADMEKKVLSACLEGLSCVFNAVGPEAMMIHLDFVRSCLSSTASDSKHRKGMGGCTDAAGEFLLPLFTLPQSLDPFLPTLIHALMNGSAQQRESAATGIAEFAGMADAAVLKPYLIKTAGPLIRVVGDRFPSSVKYSILQALVVLLNKGAASLKAFVPQLQTTFVKALTDPSRQVRLKAATALGQLMNMSTRIDPLLLELSTSVQQADSVAVRASVFDAMAQVLDKGGDKATTTGLDRAKDAAMAALGDDDDVVRVAAARSIGGVAAYSSAAKVSDLLIDLSSGLAAASASTLCGKLLACGSVLQGAGARAVEVQDDAVLLLRTGLNDDRAAVVTASCSAIAMCVIPPKHARQTPGATTTEEGDAGLALAVEEHSAMVVSVLADVAGHLKTVVINQSGDVRRVAISAIKQAAKFHPSCRVKLAKATIPALITCVSDSSIGVKAAAERAMKYLLEVGGGVRKASAGDVTALATFVSTADPENARFIKDFSKRVLSRLADDSDAEGESLTSGSW